MTYWHYTYKDIKEHDDIKYGWGVQECNSEDFNFLSIHLNNPKMVILSVTQITKEQFYELYDFANERNKN